ncbi:patatin-like phospholipase family protein [Chthonobacter rhizosphaerae]|uniref:patatin-like phospholipase family protein n=1 Tax=Chthonobacter rhizosphaerae TaxID=2735553 RepID=UPI0015EF8216|nr:patatin-like phospholipase family protein [Chthonobacter rhizosphaerae]
MSEASEGRMETVVLAGGVALGAYQGGALEAMAEAQVRPAWIAATSIGGVNGAILLGGPREDAAARLKAFWDAASFSPPVPRPSAVGWTGPDWMERALGLASAAQTHLAGNPGLFRPRVPPTTDSGGVPSLYDNAPLRRLLERSVDFDRLNDGAVRFTLLAVDVATGEEVVFDTAAGDRIGADHLIAASGLMPDFAPVAVAGRVLGDGAFRHNAPLHLVLGDPQARRRDLRCLVLDLFAVDGARPGSLGAAAERRLDLLFGGQTASILEAAGREDRLRRLIGRLAGDDEAARREAVTGDRLVVHMAYRNDGREAYSEKMFDFSRAMLDARWDRGRQDMAAALAVPGGAAGLTVVRVREGRAAAA